MVKFKNIILVLMVCCQLLLSQNTVDSLNNILNKTTNDTIKLRLYSELAHFCNEKDILTYTNKGFALMGKLLKSTEGVAQKNFTADIESRLGNSNSNFQKYYARLINSQGFYELTQGHNEKGIRLLEKALKSYSFCNDTLSMALTLNSIASSYFYMDNRSESGIAFKNSLQYFQKVNNKRGIADSYFGLGLLERTNGNITLALDYIYKALKISENLNQDDLKAKVYNSLSVLYLDVENFDKALDYALKSLELAKNINSQQNISDSYNSIAFIYKIKGNLTKAVDYLKLSTDIAEKLGDKNQLVTAYNNCGVLCKDLKKYDEADKYYQLSLKLAIEVQSIGSVANAYYKLGELYFLQNQINKALGFAEKAHKMNLEIKIPNDIKNSAGLLRDIYTKQGNYKDALQMTNLYCLMKDSILNDNNKRTAESRELKFNYDKKLQADSIKNILQKKINEEKINRQNTQLSQQKLIRIILIIGISTILILLFFTISKLKITTQQKKIIQQQNIITQQQKNELEQKNNNINDSISAAEEIQKNVFPNTIELNNLLKEHIILYKPFNKLSGDFLWIKKINQYVVIALGDCTGHGIPASLLTLLSNEVLNKIVLQNQITSPSKIINEINAEIFNFHNRKQNPAKSIKEGMDIGIAVFNTETKKINFSGAKIGLIAIKKNKELYKSQINAVELGLKEKINLLNEDELTLNEFESFYLASDGFKDLLKYKSNAKLFGYNYFENFIKENSQHSFSTQNKILNEVFINATQNENQIDDILVFGFKF